MTDHPALAARGLSKSFPGVRALRGVDLDCRSGRVHTLLGENGAGKSTLVRILTGGLPPDEGSLLLRGEPVRLHNPRDAAAKGVAAVYQELTVLPHLSVAHNILLGQEPTRYGFVHRRQERHAIDRALERVGLTDTVDPARPAGEYSLATRQLIEIARACLRDSTVLVLDEPTAVLAGTELDRLFDIVRGLTADGVAVVFISHRLDEVRAISDDVTILRDGQRISSGGIAEYSESRMVRDMVGRDVDTVFPAVQPARETVVLRVAGATAQQRDTVALPDLTVRAGEIVALAGLLGSGRSRLLRALAGVRPRSGSVSIDGTPVSDGVRGAVRAGMVLVPEERKSEGLVLNLVVRTNVTLADLASVSRRGLMVPAAEKRAYAESRSQLGIRASGGDQPTVELSGGNQQKVVLAKWLRTTPRVLLLDEPTRGIDVGARSEIYSLIADLAANGMAVIFASSDLPEVIGLAHRVLVCREGSVAGELVGDQITDERIMHLAMGSQGRAG